MRRAGLGIYTEKLGYIFEYAGATIWPLTTCHSGISIQQTSATPTGVIFGDPQRLSDFISQLDVIDHALQLFFPTAHRIGKQGVWVKERGRRKRDRATMSDTSLLKLFILYSLYLKYANVH